MSKSKKAVIAAVAIAIGLIAVWLLLPSPADPVPPLDNGGDEWTQIDQPDTEPNPEPEPDTHDYSDDHGCQGLEHGKGEKVGLHERCDD